MTTKDPLAPQEPARRVQAVELPDLAHEVAIVKFVADKRAEIKAALKELDETEKEAKGAIQEALVSATGDLVGGKEDSDVVGTIEGVSRIVWTTTHQERLDTTLLKTTLPEELYQFLTKRTAVKTFKVL